MKSSGSIAISLGLAALGPACGAPQGTPVEEVLAHIGQYYGQQITIRTRFKSGARCRQGDKGQWQTYCHDCQYCRGPLVVDAVLPPAAASPPPVPGAATLKGTEAETDDWPMILGGTWEYQDIRCKGPLNQVICYPFQPGKSYVVRGVLEHQRPPKLLVEKFWPIDE